jgi:hypothetical protein
LRALRTDPKALSNRCEPNQFLRDAIYCRVSGTRNDAPTYPVIDLICCGGKMGRHGRFPTSLPLLLRAV